MEGLSICIAAYKYDVRPLLESLSPSLRGLSIPVEILVGDDASGEPWTSQYDELISLFQVRIVRPEQNLGRVGMRNRLAREARFDWLLFLDGDSQVPDAAFVKQYWQDASTADAIAGGTLYTEHQPGAGSLRHRYGLAREMTAAAVRNQHPYARLALNNLFIKKETFWAAGGLDKAIVGYGHEDTLLGKALEKIGARLLHIDNPVIHTGLEYDLVFVAKSEEAARGLAKLYKAGKLGMEDARLIGAALRLRRWGLSWVPGLIAPLFPKSFLLGLNVRKLAAFLTEV